MKKVGFCLCLAWLVCFGVNAQEKDSISARRVIEKGTSGDLILGKENKRKQLTTSPQLLQPGDSTREKLNANTKNKKAKRRHCGS